MPTNPMTDVNTDLRHLTQPSLAMPALALPVLLLIALLVAGCSDNSPAESAAATESEAPSSGRIVRVETITLVPQTFEEFIRLTGAVESSNDAVITAQASGTVQSIADLGSRVNAGDHLARLDSRLAEAALAQAEANRMAAESAVRLAVATFDRQERLYADSILSALEFEDIRARRDQARASLRQAEAAESQARRQLEFATIQAPFSGRVEAHLINEGENVAPGTPILRLVSTNRVVISAGVPERYANDIEVGTPVRLGFTSYGGEYRTSRVQFASSVIDPSTRTFTIEVELDNRDGTLKPAMIADLFVTRSVLKEQIVVPQTAILRDELGFSVYVSNNNVAERRDVTVGPSNDGQTVITTGLEPGDVLIVAGQSNVTNGDSVTVTPSNS